MLDNPVLLLFEKFNKQQENLQQFRKSVCPSFYLLCNSKITYILHLRQSLFSVTIFPLNFLYKVKKKTQRWVQWIFSLLQVLNHDISHIKGRDNIIPAALSRV